MRKPREKWRRADTTERLRNDLETRPARFRDRVAAREKRIGPIEQIGGRPELRLPAGERELLGGIGARDANPRVDAADERLHNRAGVRAVARPLGVERAAVLHAPRHRIALDEVRAEHLRQPALHGSPPEIHLKQTILRLHETLREEQIVARPCVDVRHAPPIAHDADRRRQARNLRRTGDVCNKEGRRFGPAARRHRRGRQGRDDRKDG